MVAAVHEVRLRADTKQLRRVLETRRAEAGRLQDAIRFEVELTESIALEDLREAVWMDRDFDVATLLADRAWRHLDFDFELDFETTPRASHPVTAAIDVLVGLVRLPATASLVLQHLLGAFAKVAPRVVRTLL
jgi:hypothetical protein